MGKNQSKDKHLQEERQHSRYNNNDLQEANQKISSLQQEILQLRQNNSKNVQQLNNSNNDLNRVNQKILDLTQEINSLRQLNNNLQMENTELKQNVQNLQNQILNTPQINGVVVPILKDINQIKKITINEEVKHEEKIQLHQDNKKMPQNLIEKNQQFQLDIQNSRKNIQQYNNYELNEIIQYLQHLDIKEFNKMHQQLEQLLQAREKKNTQIVQLDELQEAQLKDVILHFRKFLDNLNQIKIEDFLSERVRYEQEASLIIQQPIEAQTDLAQIMQIFTEALEELQQIDKFYHEYIHIMLTTMQNAKSKKYSIFKIAKQGFSSQKPATDLTSNPKTLLLAIVQDYLITQLTRTENSVYYNDYKLPITLKNQDVLDASAIDYKLFTMKDNLPVIFFILLFSKNVMVLKFAENFEGKNKKLLLGEIFPEDMVQILDKFIKGINEAAILMPYLDILLDEIKMTGQGYQKSKVYFNYFIEFVNNQMNKSYYIGYRHKDFKPANIAIKKNKDGKIQKLIYIDTDDGKLMQIDDNQSWIQSNLKTFGITLPYVGPNFLLIYDLVYNQQDINTKDKFLLNIEEKIKKIQNQKLVQHLRQIQFHIQNSNEFKFNEFNKITVVQKQGEYIVEYIYDIDACIWPQIVRTAIEILVKGYNNRLHFLGQRNEMKIEQKLDQYLDYFKQGNEIFITNVAQEILKDNKNIFQLAEAFNSQEINDLTRLLSQLLPLLKEEFDVKRFQSVFSQLKQEINKENELIDCFRQIYEQQQERANKIEFQEDTQNLFVRCKGKRSRHDLFKFDLEDAVDEFITKSKNKVLLISGEGGGGKSVFIDQYYKKIWQNQDLDIYGIPIRIKLLSLKDPVKDLLGETFQKAGIPREKIFELRKSRILLILDGYDELSNDKKRNLYITNDLEQLSDCKVLITCRDTELKQRYQEMFEPAQGKGLEEIYVAPFDEEQVNEYLKKYILHRPKDDKIKWSLDDYIKNIEQLNGVKELVSSPLLLMMTSQVLPIIVNKNLMQNDFSNDLIKTTAITKKKLYEEFINKWFERQKQKLITQGESTEGIIEEYWHYAEKIASQMYIDQIWEFSHYQKTKNVNPSYFDTLFSDKEDYPPVMKAKVFHALPIKRNQDSNYSFWHANFLYFFYTQSKIQKKDINQQLYYSVKQVKQFIQQALQIISSIIPTEKYFLNQYSPQECIEHLNIILDNLLNFNEQIIRLISKTQFSGEIDQQNQNLMQQNQTNLLLTQRVDQIITKYSSDYPQIEILVKFYTLSLLNYSSNDQHIVAQAIKINEKQIEIRVYEGLFQQNQIENLELILQYELSFRVKQVLGIIDFNQTFQGYLELGIILSQRLNQEKSKISQLVPYTVQIYEQQFQIAQKNFNIQIELQEIFQQKLSLQEKLQNLEQNIFNMIKQKQNYLLTHEIEDVTYYIPLQCSTYFYALHSFDLQGKVEEYLETDEQLKVLIIFGDSGSGKTSFVENLTLKRNKIQNKQEIVIYISLPSIQNTDQILEEFFIKNDFNEEEIQILKQKQKFLFIFDAYDELVQNFNIYDSNQLDQWKSRFIFVSRTQQFQKFQNGCENFLYPHNETQTLRNLVKELYIKPFTNDQRKLFINNYVQQLFNLEKFEWEADKYEHEIINNNLEGLVETPFALKLTLVALPKIKYEDQEGIGNQQIRLNSIYRIFIIEWFEREFQKYQQKNQITLSQQEKQLKIQQWNCFAIELATQMLKEGLTEVNYKAQRNKTIENEGWGRYFDPEEEEKKWSLRACPLMVRKGNNQQKIWKFIHKSLQEYFQSINFNSKINNKFNEIQQNQLKNEKIYQKLKEGINMKLDYGLIMFMVDSLISQEISQEHLFQIIYESRNCDNVQLASSNAITILNAAKVCFSGMDLSNIQIPGANLEMCVMDYTNLEGANLSNVNFKYGWLHKANLSNSNMNNIDFGEYPPIKDHIKSVNFILLSQNDEYLISASDDETIRIYQYQNLKLLYILQHNDKIKSISLSNNENKLISLSDEIRIWDVKTGKLIFEIDQNHRKLVNENTEINSCIYSPNGNQIALVEVSVLYSDLNQPEITKIHILETQNYCQLITLQGCISDVNIIIYTSDSQKIIWCGDQKLWDPLYNIIKIWDTNNFVLINNIEVPYSFIQSMVTISDQNTILLGNGQIYNISTGNLIKTIDNQQYNKQIFKISPDGKVIAKIFGKHISLIDAETFQQIYIISSEWEQNDLCFSQDGKKIITVAKNGTMRFWKFEKNQQIFSNKKNPLEIKQIQHSNNGKLFCIVNQQKLQIWNAKNFKLITTITEQNQINYINFSYDDKYIAIFVSIYIKFYEIQRGKLITKQLQKAQLNYQNNLYIQNTKNILVDNVEYCFKSARNLNSFPIQHKKQKKIQIWNTENFSIQSSIESQMFFVSFAEFSQNGELAALVGYNFYDYQESEIIAEIWDLKQQLLKFQLLHQCYIYGIKFCVHRKFIISITDDEIFHLWDLNNGKLLQKLSVYGGESHLIEKEQNYFNQDFYKTNLNHDNFLFSSPDNEKIAYIANDKRQIYIIDLVLGFQLKTITKDDNVQSNILGTNSFINSLIFTSTSKQILVKQNIFQKFSYLQIQIWDIESGVEIYQIWGVVECEFFSLSSNDNQLILCGKNGLFFIYEQQNINNQLEWILKSTHSDIVHPLFVQNCKMENQKNIQIENLNLLQYQGVIGLKQNEEKEDIVEDSSNGFFNKQQTHSFKSLKNYKIEQINLLIIDVTYLNHDHMIEIDNLLFGQNKIFKSIYDKKELILIRIGNSEISTFYLGQQSRNVIQNLNPQIQIDRYLEFGKRILIITQDVNRFNIGYEYQKQIQIYQSENKYQTIEINQIEQKIEKWLQQYINFSKKGGNQPHRIKVRKDEDIQKCQKIIFSKYSDQNEIFQIFDDIIYNQNQNIQEYLDDLDDYGKKILKQYQNIVKAVNEQQISLENYKYLNQGEISQYQLEMSCYQIKNKQIKIFLDNLDLEGKIILEQYEHKLKTLKEQSLLQIQYQNYQDVLNLYKQIYDQCQYDRIIRIKLGDLYLKQQNSQESIKYFQEAVQINPYRAEAYCKLGQIYYQNNDLQLAKQYYQKAFQILQDGEIFSYLEKIHINLNEYDILEDLFMQTIMQAIIQNESNEIITRLLNLQLQDQKMYMQDQDILQTELCKRIFGFNFFMFHYRKDYFVIKENKFLEDHCEKIFQQKQYFQKKESKHYENVLQQLFKDEEEIYLYGSIIINYIRIMSAYFQLDQDYLENSYQCFQKDLKRFSDQYSQQLFFNIQQLLIESGMLSKQYICENINDVDNVEIINNFFKEKQELFLNENNNQQHNTLQNNEEQKSNENTYMKNIKHKIYQNQDIELFKQLYDKQQYEEAIEIGLNIIKYFPQNLNIQFLIAKSYEQLNKFNEALQIYEKINNTNSYVNAGLIYHKQLDNYQKAEQCYNLAIKLQQNEKAFQYLGSLYLILGDIQQAEYFLRQSVNLNPNCGNICELALFLMSQQKNEQNLKDLQKFVEDRIFYSKSFQLNMVKQKHIYTIKDKNLLGPILTRLFTQNVNYIEFTIGSLMYFIYSMTLFYLNQNITEELIKYGQTDEHKNTSMLIEFTQDFIQQNLQVNNPDPLSNLEKLNLNKEENNNHSQDDTKNTFILSQQAQLNQQNSSPLNQQNKCQEDQTNIPQQNQNLRESLFLTGEENKNFQEDDTKNNFILSQQSQQNQQNSNPQDISPLNFQNKSQENQTNQSQNIFQDQQQNLIEPLIPENKKNYCCDCCVLFFCEYIRNTVYSEFQSLISNLGLSLSLKQQYVPEDIQSINTVLKFFLLSFQSQRFQYQINIKILDYKQFQSKLSKSQKYCKQQRSLFKNSIYAFTYYQPQKKKINVYFFKHKINLQILKHELKRIIQIDKGDYSMLNPYFEEIEEIIQQQLINKRNLQFLKNIQRFQTQWQVVKLRLQIQFDDKYLLK